MKKLTIADVKSFEILSKEERKMVLGGEDPGSGTGREVCKIKGVECKVLDKNRPFVYIFGECDGYCNCKIGETSIHEDCVQYYKL